MSEFIDKLQELYEKKKDMETPPRYLKTVKEILDTNKSLDNPSELSRTN